MGQHSKNFPPDNEALDEAQRKREQHQEEAKKKIDELLLKVPEQYRKGAYDFAYLHGHSSGMHEVHYFLSDLVDKVFKK